MDVLIDILKESFAKHASDIHFRSSEKAWIRIDGDLGCISDKAFSHDDLMTMFDPIIPVNKKKDLNDGLEVDFSWELEGVVRFRINIYHDIQGISACFRLLPSEIKNVNELSIEKSILELCTRKKGLVLVTGPTGSGKSTTLASMIDYVNMISNGHIITIEDPIEFVFKEKNSIINQRELMTHTLGFNKALRSALREDPDTVMIGEMRDLETTMTALEVAETGHLVFSTLHTNTAASTVYRIINQFPKKKQEQIRTSLASTLIGVISQVLVPKAVGNGRIAVREIMICNHAISNLIRENKIYQINNIVQMSRNQGMITLNDALIDLIEQGEITSMHAIERSSDPNQFEKMLMERGLF